MKIINNKDKSNCHMSILTELIKSSEELLITSPFISSDINIIDQKYFKRVKELTILTTLPLQYKEQEKKINYFLHLHSISKHYGFKLTILIDNSLHGKVYIGKTASQYEAIITSANLTRTGLKINNEWGILLDNNFEISGIWHALINSPKIYELSYNEVDEYAQIIKSQKITEHKSSVAYYDFKLPAPQIITAQQSKNISYWLKPIGTTDNPIDDNEQHDTLTRDITFAIKPSGIKNGDIIICYATQKKHIVAVYIVEKEWFTNNYSTGYPYSVSGRNMYPYYGSQWSKLHITIDTIKLTVISSTKFTITPSGRNDYKCLQQADKMKVTAEYANLVMTELEVEDNRISSSTMTD